MSIYSIDLLYISLPVVDFCIITNDTVIVGDVAFYARHQFDFEGPGGLSSWSMM